MAPRPYPTPSREIAAFSATARFQFAKSRRRVRGAVPRRLRVAAALTTCRGRGAANPAPRNSPPVPSRLGSVPPVSPQPTTGRAAVRDRGADEIARVPSADPLRGDDSSRDPDESSDKFRPPGRPRRHRAVNRPPPYRQVSNSRRFSAFPRVLAPRTRCGVI